MELGRVYAWLVRWEVLREREGVKARVKAAKEGKKEEGGEKEAERGDLEKAEEWLRLLEGTQEFAEEAKGLRKEVEVLMLERE